jgi:hypothetical protein
MTGLSGKLGWASSRPLAAAADALVNGTIQAEKG